MRIISWNAIETDIDSQRLAVFPDFRSLIELVTLLNFYWRITCSKGMKNPSLAFVSAYFRNLPFTHTILLFNIHPLAYLLNHSLTQFIHSLSARSRTRSLAHSLIYSLFFVHQLTHCQALAHSLIHSFIHSFTHSLIHSFIHSLTHSFTHSLAYSLTNSFTHSFIHLFIH
jgi:hypothetical protein